MFLFLCLSNTPEGFADAQVRPDAARYDVSLGEFVLTYEAVRTSGDPRATLLDFLHSTYDAAASLGAWDTENLDCDLGTPGVPRPLHREA